MRTFVKFGLIAALFGSLMAAGTAATDSLKPDNPNILPDSLRVFSGIVRGRATKRALDGTCNPNTAGETKYSGCTLTFTPTDISLTNDIVKVSYHEQVSCSDSLTFFLNGRHSSINLPVPDSVYTRILREIR